MEKKNNTIRFRVTDEELVNIKKINPTATNFSDLLRAVILKEAKNHVTDEQRKLQILNNKLSVINEKIFDFEIDRDLLIKSVEEITSKIKKVKK